MCSETRTASITESLALSCTPGQVTLTFDDGPHPIFTPIILKILEESSIRANFFLVGAQAERNPHLVEEICRRGHIVGSHSFDHADLTKLDIAAAQTNIMKGHGVIRRLSGTETPFFRFPYLRYNRALESFVYSQGLLHFLCHINSKDWSATEPDAVVKTVCDEFDRHKGGIIGMHDAEITALALPEIIALLAPKTQFACLDWPSG